MEPGDIVELTGQPPPPIRQMDDIARARLFRDLMKTAAGISVDEIVASWIRASQAPEPRPRLRVVRDDEEPPCPEK